MQPYETEETLRALDERQAQRRRLETILSAYSSLGVLIAMFGIVYFVFTLLPTSPSVSQLMALTVAGSGIAVALMSRTLAAIRRQREEAAIADARDAERIYEFLRSWAAFEAATKARLGKVRDQQGSNSLREAMSHLLTIEGITEEDMVTVEQSLQLRNAVVHERRPTSVHMATRLTKELDHITRKVIRP